MLASTTSMNKKRELSGPSEETWSGAECFWGEARESSPLRLSLALLWNLQTPRAFV